MSSYLAVVDTLTEEIAEFDDRIEDLAAQLEETRLLMTIPGIALYSALVIYAEIGDIDRFAHAKEVGRYVGLNPLIRETDDSQFIESVSKMGPGNVWWLLVQGVHVAVHTVGDP